MQSPQDAQRKQTAEPRRVALICNPESGTLKGNPALLEALKEALSPKDRLFKIGEGTSPQDAARQAVESGADVLFAAGGDGTISAVAGVCLDAGVPLAAFPAGTFNYFARAFDLPDEPAKALDLARTGPLRPIHVGDVGGQRFLNNASLGVYPSILAEREAIYSRFGRSRIMAYWSVIKTFMRFQRPLALRMSLGDEEVRQKTPLVFLALSAFQLQTFELQGGDCIRRGKFAIFVARRSDRWAMFRAALRLVRHQMMPGEDFDLVCTNALTIDIAGRGRHVTVAVDGEKVSLPLPLQIQVHRDALQLVVPE